jgi:hypothetical protein
MSRNRSEPDQPAGGDARPVDDWTCRIVISLIDIFKNRRPAFVVPHIVGPMKIALTLLHDLAREGQGSALTNSA